MPTRFHIAAFALLALPCTAAFAQSDVPSVPAAQQQTAAREGKVVLPERSEVRVRLNEEIKSGSNQTGEEVPFVVDSDVYGPGHVLLITQGTPAYGKITQSKRRGMFGKAGSLNFTCDYILDPDGTHIPLRSDPLGQSGKSNSGAMLATTLLLSVGGVFINGKDIIVHKGQQFTMYINENTAVAPPTFGNAPAVVIPAAVPAPPPAASAAPGKSLFTMKDGNEVVGVMNAFNGKTYTVTTDKGVKYLAATKVKSIYALK